MFKKMYKNKRNNNIIFLKINKLLYVFMRYLNFRYCQYIINFNYLQNSYIIFVYVNAKLFFLMTGNLLL